MLPARGQTEKTNQLHLERSGSAPRRFGLGEFRNQLESFVLTVNSPTAASAFETGQFAFEKATFSSNVA